VSGKVFHIEAILRIRLICLIGLFLTIAILAVYGQVRDHEFINLDDFAYVVENQQVNRGLSFDGLRWAFTSNFAANWHPLTWLSHMLDCELFGMSPGAHHQFNVLIHIANTLLLLWIFFRLTGDKWSSSLVAALFALHPLNVESVAWIAQRKNIICTFLWISAIGAYIRYVKRPCVHRLMWVLLFYVLGLMAKPMVVTLPFVLLLLDYWPLNRLQTTKVALLIKEKIPFFFFSAASGIITFVVQRSGGAVSSLDVLPFDVRLSNALISYLGYIGKMFWPQSLAILYPHPRTFSAWQVTAAFLLFAGLSIFIFFIKRRYPYILVGWLWYAVTLVPVIGLVQVGVQSMADRYTYIPMIGLFIVIAWSAQEIVKNRRYLVKGVSFCLVMLIAILSFITSNQIGYWKNSITLFGHALTVTKNNYLAHNNMGLALIGQNKLDGAIRHYLEAIRINPEFDMAYLNLGNALYLAGKPHEASQQFVTAVNLNPKNSLAHNNLAATLAKQGRIDEAIEHLNRALTWDSTNVDAHRNLGSISMDRGDFEKSAHHYRAMLTVQPNNEHAHNNLGISLVKLQKLDEAICHFADAIRIDPGFIEARHNLNLAVREKKAKNISWFFEPSKAE
jgi:tetratricopeptide (TPR) repeat protein